MTKKAWDVLITIVGIALDVVILIKEKIYGGKNDTGGNSKEKRQGE